MTITKSINGAYVISSIVNGYLVTRTYMGFTKKEALAMFKDEVIK